jgi:peptidoglycan/xylan/chitin deacetylase (PgdA/CDA1 family)
MKARTGAALVGGLGAAAGQFAPAATFFPPVRRLAEPWVLCRAGTGRAEVALTFDDGPDPEMAPRFLDLLGHTPATFFWLGWRVRAHSDLVRRAVASGHEVACHGDDHRTLARMGPRGTIAALERARDSIAEAAGRAPGFYRPAYGVWNGTAWAMAPRLGMQRTLWCKWAWDWHAKTTTTHIVERILRGAAPGAILLLHDAGGAPGAPQRTLAALPEILDGLRDRGLRPVTLSQLIAPSDGSEGATSTMGVR